MNVQPTEIKKACEALQVKLSDGSMMPRLGQGTWHMGDHMTKRKSELEALRLGIDLGMTLIDTAEMYGEGKSESLIGEAIRGVDRNRLFLVSKVYPHNAGGQRLQESCEKSLRRLGVDCLDLYLLHWRGSIPLRETVAGMEKLIAQGKIRRWGVSNFDIEDMKELWSVPGGDRCAVNQVLYHIASRGVEYSLLPWMKEHGVPLMAYCPVAQAGNLQRGMLKDSAILAVAEKYGITPAQVLLAFVLRDQDVIAIPKAGTPSHTRENAEAALIKLTQEDIALLSKSFPAPKRKMYLDMQ